MARSISRLGTLLSALKVGKLLFRQERGKVINRNGLDAVQVFHLSDGFDLPTADVVADLLIFGIFSIRVFGVSEAKVSVNNGK